MSIFQVLDKDEYPYHPTINIHLLDPNRTMLKADIKHASETSSVFGDTGFQTTHSDNELGTVVLFSCVRMT